MNETNIDEEQRKKENENSRKGRKDVSYARRYTYKLRLGEYHMQSVT
jgi:hypothetical protein